jgi:hypothetical protein
VSVASHDPHDTHVLDAVVLFLLGAVLVLVGVLTGVVASEHSPGAPAAKPTATAKPEPRGTVLGKVMQGGNGINGYITFVPFSPGPSYSAPINSGNYVRSDVPYANYAVLVAPSSGACSSPSPNSINVNDPSEPLDVNC